MRKNYSGMILVLSDSDLESFVQDWLHQRYKDYVSHERWSGTGDMGRDVTGYVTKERMDGPWDNYQCKQLSKPLSEKSLFVELGKIFMHSAAGAYELPRNYIFVAPRGVGRNVRNLVAHPVRLKQEFLDRWDTYIADDLVKNSTVKLTPDIEVKIRSFDFANVHWLDANLLAKDDACIAALVKWFDADPGPSPKGVVPVAMQSNESAYLGQLLKVYEEHGLGAYTDPEAAFICPTVGPYLKIQRTRFFDATAFDRFYRDSTPEELVQNFGEEVHHGVIDVHQAEHVDKFSRLNKVMQQAALLQASGVLGRHASPQVKQGTCHLLANKGDMPWD